MTHFSFKEEDHLGLDTLKAISNADRFNGWMTDQIKPYLKGNVLEIGSGIGNISACLLNEELKLTLSDVRTIYCDFLEAKFTTHKNIKEVRLLNLIDEDFDEKYADLFSSFDGAFALNVIEHIDNDELAIKNLSKLIKPGGVLAILVPAIPKLYNKLDYALQHYRRYKKSRLTELINNNGFKTEKAFYFNALGIPAWWVNGSLLKKEAIQNSQMNVYDHLVPIAKMLDWCVSQKIGLSVIAISRKT
jgi:SAM-dependent methyltransferase